MWRSAASSCATGWANVRPAGLSHDLAAFKLNWLLTQAFSRGLTGVNLKDESDRLIEAADSPESLAPPA